MRLDGGFIILCAGDIELLGLEEWNGERDADGMEEVEVRASQRNAQGRGGGDGWMVSNVISGTSHFL